ncbi:uncharacterized protein LOC128872636 [Hylaeus volcanicus]|uniref:uncharacterized protein LOC128872636 n=1 Tax=Hylaeus volcanicus TaxID=313075 RepID=UPI0023B7D319|nr:uncharacterized protein LOC128872636 [Hylaeus volcanicus]
MDYTDNGQFGMSYTEWLWSYVASVGWYLIGIAIVIWYASPNIWEKYSNWKLRKDEQEYAAKYHKNPDLLQERLSALEASRQKMQQEYYQKCMLVHPQGGEHEGKQKKQSILMDANLAGHKLGNNENTRLPSDKKSHKSLRGEYNPLMGDSSKGYRPPKRSCCSKGSCG